MPFRPRVRHAWRRTREVGAAGLLRRAGEPIRESRRAALREAWARRHAEPLPDEELLRAFDPARAAAMGGARGARAELLALSRTLGRGSFFLDTADASLRRGFAERHAAGCGALLAQADATLAGDLAWVVPGGTADWHRGLPAGPRWPA